MITKTVRVASSRLCSIRNPYHAFVSLEDVVTIYNSTTDETYRHMLTGHGVTSMITTDRSVFLGTANGTFVQIQHGCRSVEQTQVRSINGIGVTPIFLFASDGHLLCVGTGWKRTQNHMRCGEIAMVWRGEPFFYALQGEILAHRFDAKQTRQLFVTMSETPVQYQLCVISLETIHGPPLRYGIDMGRLFDTPHGSQRVHAVSRNGEVAFIDDGVFFIVSPMRGQTKPDILFAANAAVKKLYGHFASFCGEEDTFLVHGAISGPTALQVSIAKCDNGRWESCMSYVMDVQNELQNSSLLACSVVRDSKGDDKSLILKLLSEDDSGEDERYCTLMPMFACVGIESLVNGDSASSTVGYTEGVSLLDEIDLR
jgi:hypothetical protein